jgi:hypothetical protein
LNIKERKIDFVIRDENNLVNYLVEEKKIKLTFFDGKEVNELSFYINNQGNIDVDLYTDNGEMTKKSEIAINSLLDTEFISNEEDESINILQNLSNEELFELVENIDGPRYDYHIYHLSKVEFGVYVKKRYDINSIDEIEREGFKSKKEAREYIKQLSNEFPIGCIFGLDFTIVTPLDLIPLSNVPKRIIFSYEDKFYSTLAEYDDNYSSWYLSNTIIDMDNSNVIETKIGEDLYSIIHDIEDSIGRKQ